jgi:hypothetical protein
MGLSNYSSPNTNKKKLEDHTHSNEALIIGRKTNNSLAR